MSDYVSVALRNATARRAEKRCEYCGLHEDDTLLPHEPDHIIATKHGGETILDNLAWACFVCNRYKGSDIASVDPQSQKIERLFHPRTDHWSQCFLLERAGVIQGLNAQGRVTVFLLRMNLRESVEIRRMLIAAGRYPYVT